MKLTTNDVVEILGVSRQWVNRYLRDMGSVELQDAGKTIKRVVVYDAEQILAWINSNAECSRQTVEVPAAAFGRISNEEAAGRRNLIDSLMSTRSIEALERADELWEELYRLALPEALYAGYDATMGNARHRGATPWAPVDYQMSELTQLRSIDQLMEQRGYRNNELAYREIYRDCWIRISVAGRRWYVPAPEQYDCDPQALLRLPYALLTGV